MTIQKGRPLDINTYKRNEMKWLRAESRHLRAMARQLLERADSVESLMQAEIKRTGKTNSYTQMQNEIWKNRKYANQLKIMVNDFRQQANEIKASLHAITDNEPMIEQEKNFKDIVAPMTGLSYSH